MNTSKKLENDDPGKPAASQSERELDEALGATFPASDPVSGGHETSDEEPRSRVGRKTPELDVALVERLARELRRDQKE